MSSRQVKALLIDTQYRSSHPGRHGGAAVSVVAPQIEGHKFDPGWKGLGIVACLSMWPLGKAPAAPQNSYLEHIWIEFISRIHLAKSPWKTIRTLRSP